MIQAIRIVMDSQLVVQFTTSLVNADDILKQAYMIMHPGWRSCTFGTWALEHYNTDDNYDIGWERYV